MGKTLVALKWVGPQDVVLLAILAAFLQSVAGTESKKEMTSLPVPVTSCSKMGYI